MSISQMSNIFNCFGWFIPNNSYTHLKKTDEMDEMEKGDVVKGCGKNEYVSKWTYWGIYINYGLKGSFFNLYRMNPISIVMIVLEIIVSFNSTYAMKNLTIILTNSESSSEVMNLISENLIIFVFLAMAIFSYDIKGDIQEFTREKNEEYNKQITTRIMNSMRIVYINSSMNIFQKYSVNEYWEAVYRFMWVYERTTDTIVETTVQIFRSFILIIYILWNDQILFPVIVIICWIMWKYIIPKIAKKENDDKESNELWDKAYYAMAFERYIKLNPQYGSLIDPNHTTHLIDVMKYYNNKHQPFVKTQKQLQKIQNIIIYIIISLLLWSGKYTTAIIMLINRGAFFELINTYLRMIEVEKNAEKSLGKIIKIHTDIDEDEMSNCHSNNEFEFNSDNFNCQLIEFDQMTIPIKIANKADKMDEVDEESQDLDESTKCEKNKESNITHIMMSGAKIRFGQKKRVIILDGETACGKSQTMDTLGGVYTDNRFTNMRVHTKQFDNEPNQELKCEFKDLRSHRVYISQSLTEDYVCNGAIRLNLEQLYPNCESIEELNKFLTEGFGIKPRSIPKTLNQCPHEKLSGGERQRFIISSEIWKIMKADNVDFVIFDEIDGAVGKKIGIQMMKWIVENLNKTIIIVSHLTEVKNLLFEMDVVQSCWTYSEPENGVVMVSEQRLD
jgi:ABC-type lipoprotein export system ATPase subunit